jgi:16S rRNA (guanine966-N2)-methyltransferase
MCQDVVVDAYFLDLFAGSGAMGLEALSRGARHATFIESQAQAFRVLKENVQTLDMVDHSCCIQTTCRKALLDLQGKRFHLIYMDPPYSQKVEELPSLLLECVEKGAYLGIEKNKQTAPLQELEGWDRVTCRTYGEAELSLYRRLYTQMNSKVGF